MTHAQAASYTFAILDVSPAAYEEIRSKLEAAGYSVAVTVDYGGTIDMHGIALRALPDHNWAPGILAHCRRPTSTRGSIILDLQALPVAQRLAGSRAQLRRRTISFPAVTGVTHGRRAP